MERAVALKVMSAELAKDENQRKRFRAEAKAASALAHPNICVIHEVGETDDARPFLAMEYVEGETLDEIIKQRRLRMREIISLGLEASEALQAAHARGLVHRDIKPANIMLDQRGHVKVLDFGLAKRFAQGELSASAASETNTRTGMLIGTPHYMSPEQVLGRELNPRSDIFSLGAVLYELVAGQRPFGGRTIGETINNVVNQTPEPLGLENPLFTPALDQIIFRCLEKEPQNRYATAKALAKDLARLRNEADRLAAAKASPAASLSAATVPSREHANAELPVPAAKRPAGIGVAVVAAAVLVLAGIVLQSQFTELSGGPALRQFDRRGRQRLFERRVDRGDHDRSLAHSRSESRGAELGVHVQGQKAGRARDRAGLARERAPGGQRQQSGQANSGHGPAYQRGRWVPIVDRHL
ncbi:MAG: hypothetical protein DME25_08740 [Verrucomicrobia bacterium]|nr:MAG: hypothetical protein DME25_08740 [Verrucomicrobiota bacterium]